MTKNKLTEEKHRLLKRLIWDYNVSAEDVYALISGEKSYAGHCDFDHLFIRMLERLRWYDLLDLLGRKTLQKKLEPMS